MGTQTQPPVATCGRSGLTVIEVCVVIAIVGILAAVMLPAILGARQTSMKVVCGSQLRDIGIACQMYVDTCQVYPPRWGDWRRKLQPYLGYPSEQDVVPMFGCPSDTEHAIGDFLHCSYAINDGFGRGFPGVYRNGIVAHMGNPISEGEIIDGRSTTAAFSERLSYPRHAPSVIEWDHFPHLANRGLQRIFNRHLDPESYYQECRDTVGGTALTWYGQNEYQHVMPPNHNNCMTAPSAHNPDPGNHAVITAASPHAGGTHTVFCDGHLQFVSESIDVGVWRALGTRNGQEAEANDAF